jgi:hypothetical protein
VVLRVSLFECELVFGIADLNMAFSSFDAQAEYCKGCGVNGERLAKELGPRVIAVDTIAPDAIATDFSCGVARDSPR